MKLIMRMAGKESARIELPINYRPLIHGMLYTLLSPCEPYAEKLHEQGGGSGRVFKGFTFSPLQGVYRVENHTIAFSGEILLEIRSVDPVMTALLYHEALSAGSVKIGAQVLEVRRCRLEDRHIREEKIRIRMVSPAVVYSTDDSGFSHFFSPNDPEFADMIRANAMRKCAHFRLPAPDGFRLALLPDSRPRKQLSSFKQTVLEGWFANFEMESSAACLDLLYQTGLGAKNSEGFGMFEVLG